MGMIGIACYLLDGFVYDIAETKVVCIGCLVSSEWCLVRCLRSASAMGMLLGCQVVSRAISKKRKPMAVKSA